MNAQPPDTDFDQICFGLSRELDERSLAIFLRLLSREELLRVLLPRLDEAEILRLVDTVTGILQHHLEEKEYHELFLGDFGHHH
ncbi:hypothetical protein [Candidatus Electronema sp. JM]|uniref:hypothetical protein n=1 Tax=Candidatus Electronema sp. JM TaxID=3401571 RepID=UPI003AA99A48